MMRLATEELEKHLPDLVNELRAGHGLLLEYEGKVIARVVPEVESEDPRLRNFGFAKGRFRLADDFDAPLDEFEPYT